MNKLILLQDDGKFPVKGRALHENLQIETPYHKWFPRMCEYGFIENADYSTKDKNVRRQDGTKMPQKQTDHMLSISMAKELCMLQRTEIGRQVRRYLISVEDQWNTPAAVMARALIMADATIHSISAENVQLLAEVHKKEQIIGELKPKADYTDYILSSRGAMNTSQIAADYGLTAQKLNSILHEEHIQRKVADQWILYAEHLNKGFTKSETISIERTGGIADTKLHTKWTQKGRLMINEVLNRRGIYANMDLVGLADQLPLGIISKELNICGR